MLPGKQKLEGRCGYNGVSFKACTTFSERFTFFFILFKCLDNEVWPSESMYTGNNCAQDSKF